MADESTAFGQGRRRHAFRSLAVVPILAVVRQSTLSLSWLRSCRMHAALALIVVCLASAPLPSPSAHDPLMISAAEAARHTVLVDQEFAEHGHSHDDGEVHEQSAGHLHGHDAADHSHQAFFLMATSGTWGPPASWHESPLIGDLPDPVACCRIDRPPKQSLSV